jgi:hypothetical protein
MSVSSQFYLEQAAKCARSASDAALDNQRETFLRSQEAWQAMADRAIRVDAERAKRDAARETVSEPAISAQL